MNNRSARSWTSLASRSRRRKRGKEAERELAEAYRRVFGGTGSPADAQIVMTDLANYSGFFKAMGRGFTPDDRAHLDGQRSVFARVFRFVRLSDQELVALQEAARVEALIDADEGDI